MPSNLSFLDTNFPTFTDEDSTEKKINTIQDYLYMTVESLRYALSHLNEGNMEQDFVRSIVRGDGSLAEITQRVSQNEANIEILTSVTSGHTQNIASLTQSVTADEAKLALVVSTSSGENVVNAASIVAAVNATSGSSIVQIDADHIVMTGATTFLTKTVADTYYDENGAATSAVSGLESNMALGYTVINGKCITTDTISLNTIKCLGSSLTVKNAQGVSVGNIGYATGLSGGSETAGMAVNYDSDHYVICTSAGVRLQCGSNSIYVTSHGCYFDAGSGGTPMGYAVWGG